MSLFQWRPHRVSGASSYYRGAQLPTGVTLSGLLLSTPFSGTVYNTSTLAIGSSRYNAAETLTVSNTGSQGRTDFLAHLATAAADGTHDYRIILPASVLSGGVYTLPAKADPTKHCWIVATSIHTDTFGTPAGSKIPASTTGMATLQGPASNGSYVVNTADSASARGYSVHGIVIQNNPGNYVDTGLLYFTRTTNPTDITGCPGEIFVERCWLRGTSTDNVRRGVMANGPYFKILDSRLTDIHYVGNESAGIGSFSGGKYHEHGRLTINAGAQTILGGGADPFNPNTNLLDPSDWYSYDILGEKPLTWLPTHPSWDGSNWLTKTGFEAKNMRRWLIDRSITRNCWVSGQTGHAMLFQNLSDNNGNHLENRIEDIVVRHHWLDHVQHGPTIAARVVYNGGTLPTHPAERLVFDNILITKNGGDRSTPTMLANNSGDSGGRSWQLFSDIQGVTIDRMTSDGERWIELAGSGGKDYVITNHVARGGTYGISRDSATGNLTGLNATCSEGGLVFDGNVMYDYAQGSGNYASYTPGCDANETNSSMAFEDYAAYDYRLTDQHLTKGVGGGVPGADIAALTAALSGVN